MLASTSVGRRSEGRKYMFDKEKFGFVGCQEIRMGR
jgi:hypothetical protein